METGCRCFSRWWITGGQLPLHLIITGMLISKTTQVSKLCDFEHQCPLNSFLVVSVQTLALQQLPEAQGEKLSSWMTCFSLNCDEFLKKQEMEQMLRKDGEGRAIPVTCRSWCFLCPLILLSLHLASHGKHLSWQLALELDTEDEDV